MMRPVKFMVEYPIQSHRDGGAWLQPANMAEFAQVAEAVGVDALSLTDHPAPSKKWLDAGGHETLDPFTGRRALA
jgi:alkanesulfonate monooxygenase SsuD/methylene tetrahydromethanopterin reductase-like flavin-dependent oxidoreductase (luciferase family)